MNTAATTPTTAAKTSKKSGKTGSTKSAKASAGPVTLAELAERYVRHLEQVGKSRGTVFSYGVEMELAQAVLGAEAPIASITEAMVKQFFDCDRVQKTKGGRPKARPTILKSQRVLRLALAWAIEKGWIEKLPMPATVEATLIGATTISSPTEQA